MKLFGFRPMLWVNDVRTAIDYYVSVLGFTETTYSKDWEWGEVARDEIIIMLAKPNEHTPYDKPQFTGSLYINTDNADELWEELKNKANIYYSIENFEYGMREFAVKDCNGYILQFGQELQN